jgi:hypothetical protein
LCVCVFFFFRIITSQARIFRLPYPSLLTSYRNGSSCRQKRRHYWRSWVCVLEPTALHTPALSAYLQQAQSRCSDNHVVASASKPPSFLPRRAPMSSWLTFPSPPSKRLSPK